MLPENRISVIAAALAVIAGLLAALWAGLPAAVALLVGAGLSLGNYRWLKAGARAMLPDTAAAGPAPAALGATAAMGWGMLRFAARLLLLALCLCAIFISHLLPFSPVVWGLFAVPAGAMVEAVWQLVQYRGGCTSN
ncbi:MAG: hypothetical protein ACRD01_12550 [Terriglobales bacterium]